MDENKKERLEKAGWKFGSAEEFLGDKMERYYIECDCYSQEHTICFTLDDDEEFPCIYVNVQLSRFHNFFGRLWLAIKYVFGHECRFGHWDEAVISGEKVSEIYDLCYRHLQQFKKVNERKGKANGNDIDNNAD
jgi:hypothetical protein